MGMLKLWLGRRVRWFGCAGIWWLCDGVVDPGASDSALCTRHINACFVFLTLANYSWIMRTLAFHFGGSLWILERTFTAVTSRCTRRGIQTGPVCDQRLMRPA